LVNTFKLYRCLNGKCQLVKQIKLAIKLTIKLFELLKLLKYEYVNVVCTTV
jgi:hypothetical protein